MAKSENHVVHFYSEENYIARTAISTLAVRIHEYKRKFDKKSIILTGCSASNGTTTIAINLAVYLAQAGFSTLLIDADMRTAVRHESRVGDKGLSDILSGQHGEVRHTNIDNLYFMPSGTPIKDPALLMSKERSTDFLGWTSTKFDFVIVDCPAVTVVPETLSMFAYVDGILLICSLEKTTKKQLQAAKRMLEPYADKYYGLVTNSVDERQYRQLFPNRNYYAKKEKRVTFINKIRQKIKTNIENRKIQKLKNKEKLKNEENNNEKDNKQNVNTLSQIYMQVKPQNNAQDDEKDKK